MCLIIFTHETEKACGTLYKHRRDADDMQFWLREGPRKLVKYIANATGEAHDAVVYATEFEFDRHNYAAVKYMAKKALEAAISGSASWSPDIPGDGSVARMLTISQDTLLNPKLRKKVNEKIIEPILERQEREQNDPFIYCPDTKEYHKHIRDAYKCYQVKPEEFDDNEQKDYDEYLAKVKANKCEARHLWTHNLIPAIVFAVWVIWLCATKRLGDGSTIMAWVLSFIFFVFISSFFSQMSYIPRTEGALDTKVRRIEEEWPDCAEPPKMLDASDDGEAAHDVGGSDIQAIKKEGA